jgi:hypothetical protein
MPSARRIGVQRTLSLQPSSSGPGQYRHNLSPSIGTHLHAASQGSIGQEAWNQGRNSLSVLLAVPPILRAVRKLGLDQGHDGIPGHE